MNAPPFPMNGTPRTVNAAALLLVCTVLAAAAACAQGYVGDFAEDSVVHFKWSTYDTGGASVTRATNGTVYVYRDDATSESTAGVTDTEDHDSRTGIHHCKIDLSADAFYATGADYTVVLVGATIDGTSVNAVLAQFSIENRFREADVVKWLGTACATPTTAGVPETDVTHWRGEAVPATTQTGRPKVDVEYWAGLASVSYDNNMLPDVNASAISESQTAANNLESAFTGGGYSFPNCTMPWNAAWDAEVQSECADALAAYDPPTKAELDAGLAALNDPTSAAIADAVLDELLAGHTGAGSLAKALADILEDTGTTLPGTLTGLAGAGFDTATDSLEALRDRGDGAWATAAGFSTHAPADVRTAIETDGSKLDLVHDWWADGGRLDLLLDAVKERTDNLPDDPADDSDIDAAIAGLNDPTAASVADAVLDELLAEHTGAGSLAKALADILEDTGTTLPGTLTGLAGAGFETGTDSLEALRGVADAVQAKTDNLPADPADDSDLDTQLAALAATLAAIKGDGWTDETLKAIKDAIDAIDVEGVADWSDAEKEQLRSALGIDGDKTAAAGGQLQALRTVADAIKVKTDLITAGAVDIVSPVAADQSLTIVRGDDYADADGRALTWTVEGWTGPDLTDATATFRLMTRSAYERGDGTAVLSKAGTVSEDGGTVTIKVELTAAETAALGAAPPNQPLSHKYHLRLATAAGRKLMQVIGDCTVTADVPAAP